MRGALLLGAMLLAVPAIAQEPVKAPDPKTEQTLGIRYLYGSAEAAALSTQSYNILRVYALDKAKHLPKESVILAEGAAPETPRFVPCAKGAKPAVVFDADETLIWNTGSTKWLADHGLTYDSKVWLWWEKTGAGKVKAVPGAVETVNALRAARIEVIVNTNRASINAEDPADDQHWKGTVATLKAAGLGDFVPGKTLFLKGAGPNASGKDTRRKTITESYCVIAMAGDQLGDFSDAFNDPNLKPAARKSKATSASVASLWGNGWFLLPNPLYGPWDKLSFSDVFDDADKW